MSGFKLTWNGPQITAATKAAALEGIRDGAEFILGKSKEIVPHEWGALSRSGHVEELNNGYAIVFSTPYAVIQHEALGFRHPNPNSDKSSSGRSAKYLEKPFTEHKPKVLKLISAKILAATKGG